MNGRIDKNLLADMFARAAELKAGQVAGQPGQAPDARAAAGRVLLSSIFARARELRPKNAPGPEDETSPLAGRPRDQTARGWNPEADQRSRPAQSGEDPDDLLSTRFLDRESAIEEFRSSLETLFKDSDSDEQMLLATDSMAGEEGGPLRASSTGEMPSRASNLFNSAAEELFGMDIEDLEQLVLEAWERRMRGEPSLAPAPRAAVIPPAYTAGPTMSPALVSLEDGEPLLDAPKKKDLSSSDVDHILTDFAFDGGNPVPAAEVVRRAKEQVQPIPAPAPAPQPAPAPAPQQPPPAWSPENVPTQPWGAPPRDASAAATLFDPFARPIPLPTPARSPAADAFAAPPRGGPLDAFAPPPPGVDAFGRPRAPGQTPPPSWRTGSGPQPVLPGQAPAWKVGSGQQPALPPGGWHPQPPQAPHAPQPPQAPQAPHVPAGWPFVDGPTAPPQRTASGRLQPPAPQPPAPPPSGRFSRPPAPGQAPPPAGARPRSPPSGEGFDPFAPSWWDEKPSDGDVKL